MSERRSNTRGHLATGPWVIDTRDFGRRPGVSQDYRRTVHTDVELGVPGVIVVAKGAEVELDVLAESVMEGVLISGTATTEYTGDCARCLDPVRDELRVDITELFAYPDSTTEETTDDDEVFRLVDDLIDLEPIVRDAVVLALPHAPLCSEDCRGLCVDCGRKWAELEPNHVHERLDPRWAALREKFGPAGDQADSAEDA